MHIVHIHHKTKSAFRIPMHFFNNFWIHLDLVSYEKRNCHSNIYSASDLLCEKCVCPWDVVTISINYFWSVDPWNVIRCTWILSFVSILILFSFCFVFLIQIQLLLFEVEDMSPIFIYLVLLRWIVVENERKIVNGFK